MKNTLLAAAVTAAMTAGSVGSVAAHPHPERPIRYILHVSPGGATDMMARNLAIGLDRLLGHHVVVENKAGGRGAAQMTDIVREAGRLHDRLGDQLAYRRIQPDAEAVQCRQRGLACPSRPSRS